MKRRLNVRLWSVLLGLAMVMCMSLQAQAEYVPGAADFFWASHEAAAYGLSSEDVFWMLENGKTRSEIETSLCKARPRSQYATGATEYRDLAGKWNVTSGEAIDAYKISLEIGANPEAYLYAEAQGRSPEEAQAALRRYVAAKKAVQRLGIRGDVEIPGDIEMEDTRNASAAGAPKGAVSPAPSVIRSMTVGPYSARSSSAGALAAGGSAVWCTLEDRRSAAAHAIASVYSFPAHDNPEGFVLELFGKGLSTEKALAVMFALDCAWDGESSFVSTPWSPDVLSLPSDQLVSEAGEMADMISLFRLWKVEPIPYEARRELRQQGFLGPEAIDIPPASIEPEADLGPLASGAGEPSIVDPGVLYDCGKVSPFNRYFEGLSETIDPKTGALIVRQKDLTLPGRNGFDLVIERVYNSQQAAAGKPIVDVRAEWRVRTGSEEDWSELSSSFVERGQTYRYRFAGGISWERQWVSSGTIRAWFSGTVYKMLWKPDSCSWACVDQNPLEDMLVIPAPEGSMEIQQASATARLDIRATYLDHKYGIGLGWSFAFPSVEIIKEDMLLHLGDGSVHRVDFSCGTPSNLFDYWLRDLVFTRGKARFSGAESESAFCLAAKDGTKTYFASDGRLLWTSDRFGNTVIFRYQKVGEWRRIAQIIDSLGRIVQFVYSPSSVTMSVQGRIWTYALSPQPVAGQVETKSVLASVTDPHGRAVQFQYSPCEASFGASIQGLGVLTTGHNLFSNLVRISHPTGGWSRYEYEGTPKNMTKDDPWKTDECTMTVFRVTRRSDEVGAQNAANVSQFSYFREGVPDSEARRYGTTRSQVPLEPYQSSRPCIEEWAYTPEHLLTSHSAKDALTGETKKTVYRYNDGKMLIQEDTTVQCGTAPAVAAASMKYEWDAYGNLRGAENALTGAETEYEYDPRYHVVVYTAEKASSSPRSPAGWRYTINVLDDTGQKITSSSQSMQKPVWEAKPARTAPIGCRLVDIGDDWESWTAGPASAAQLDIDWVRGPFQAVGYAVSYRRRGDSQWIPVASLGHGWFSPGGGRDTVPISFPEPGVYSIGVRMNSGLLKWTYATIVSMTEQPYERAFPVPDSARATVRYDYEDPGYSGNVTRRTVVQPGGQDEITSFTYDPAGHAYPVSVSTRVTAVNGTGSTVVVGAEYDSFGRVTKYTTSAGASSSTTTFDYDEIGRMTKATYPAVGGLASAKEWRWNDEARMVTRIDEEGRSLIEQYDQLGRFVELRRPAALPNLTETAVTKVGYNSLGGVAYEEDAAGRRTSYEYDGFGRRIKTVYPDGSFETTSFEVCRSDPSGAVSVETVTDALGRYTKTYLDTAGRKVRVEQEAENGLSTVTRFEYDLLGRITRMVDPAGQETLYSYSTQTPSGTVYGYWDSPLEVDLPGGTEPVHKCMYDSCGRTIQSDGTANAYDQLGRLKRATYPDRTYATFYYDKDSRLTEARLFGADGKPVCKTGTDYDARGRKTGEWWDVWGTRYSIGYEYNKAGDVVRMTFPDGASVEYVYDGWGRLLAIPSLFGTGAFDPGFFYAQSGALSRIGRANGVPTVIAEDVRGRVDRITHGQGGQPILDLDYEYDSVGNVVRISGREYTYDRLGRLVGYQRLAQSGALEWVGYGYDLVGNRISESAGGVIGRRYSYDPGNYLSRTIDQTGRIESAFTYGSFGEQLTRTSGGVATNYVYDAAQRLRAASRDGAVIASAVYDALGRRVGYTDSSGTVLTLYSGNDVVYELTNPPVAPDDPGTGGSGGSGGRPGKQPGWIVIDDPVGPIFLDPDEPADPIVISPRLPGGGSQPGEQGGTGDSGNPGKPGNPPPPEPVRIAARYIVAHGKYLAKMVQEGESAAQTYFLHTDMLGSIRAVTDSAGQVVARFDYEPFGLLIEQSGTASAGGERYTGKPRDAALGLYYFGARYYDPELGRFITADPAKDGLNWYVYCANSPLAYIDPDGQLADPITLGAGILWLSQYVSRFLDRLYTLAVDLTQIAGNPTFLRAIEAASTPKQPSPESPKGNGQQPFMPPFDPKTGLIVTAQKVIDSIRQNTNTISHILKGSKGRDHCWNLLVGKTPTWEKIESFVQHTLTGGTWQQCEGQEGLYIASKIFDGLTVRVRIYVGSDLEWVISNAWVAR